MSDFISAMSSLFTFVISQLSNIADFFVESTLGQIILGVALFSLIFTLISYVIDKFH